MAIQGGRAPRGGINLDQVSTPKLYVAMNPIPETAAVEKILFLQELDAKARARSAYVIQVQATLSISYREVLIAATDGTLGADITVAFADSSNTAVTCSIAAVTEDSQPVGITVIVGHGATAVTFA